MSSKEDKNKKDIKQMIYILKLIQVDLLLLPHNKIVESKGKKN